MTYLREFHYGSAVFRLILALCAGGILGYGRARKQRSAGMRTYMLTCLGASLTILISIYESEMLDGPWAWAAEYTALKFDGSRFSAQVINGMGFLAAGTIVGVAHRQVSGLTTAIGLFGTAVIGIACGSGFYEGVVLAVPLTAVAMEALAPVEKRYKRRLRNITVCVAFRDLDDMAQISAAVAGQGAQVFDIDLEEGADADGQSAILSLKLAKGAASHSAMLSSLAELPCVRSVQELIS